MKGDEWDILNEWKKAAREAVGDAQIIGPENPFQYKFLLSQADIAIGGGSAGGGKTYALLLEPTRYRHIPDFSATIFRRTIPEIENAGGLWDEAVKMYAPSTGGYPIKKPYTWFFPHPENNLKRGARVIFTHLQHASTVYRHKGGQYPLIMFDELDSFEKNQFWYMLSRNRSDIGINSYCRATTNPDSSGWLKDLVSWWLYPDDYPDETKAGYPIKERIGQIRYLFRESETNHWANSVEEIVRRFPQYFPKDDPIRPRDKIKTVTFIPGSVYENKRLLEKDPTYISNLMAQSTAERNRLLFGCWRFVPGEDDLFDYGATEDLFTNDFVPEETQPQRRYITADIALEGADKFVVMVWHGWVVVKCYVFEKISSDRVLAELRRIAQIHAVPARNIAYDRDGVGDFISGFFRSSYGFRGNAQPVPFLRPKQNRNPRADVERPPNYENLRAQVYFEFARKTLNAEIFVRLPDQLKRLILEELNATKKAPPTTAGKLRIRPKAEIASKIGRSPDFADALVMRMIFDFAIQRKSGRASSSGIG